MERYCDRCGRMLTEGFAYCDGCGVKIAWSRIQPFQKPPVSKEILTAINRKVVEKLVDYGRGKRLLGSGSILLASGMQSEAHEFLITNPNAFLIGIINAEAVSAEAFFSVPYRLRNLLGHLNPDRIGKMPYDELVQALRKCRGLCRKIPGYIQQGCRKIVKEYNGNAENIWIDFPTSRELVARFDAFDGVGQKKSTMAANILVRDLGVKVKDDDWSGIDVSYDQQAGHVGRVFLRAGLVEVDEKQTVIEAARHLNPNWPGALDLPAWLIGRERCHEKSPECHNCPINSVCPRKPNKSMPNN